MKKSKLDLPKAIFFDMDDTIITVDGKYKEILKEVCKTFIEKTDVTALDLLLHEIDVEGSWYWSDPERHRVGRLDLNLARKNIVFNALKKLGCEKEEYAIEMANNYEDLHYKRLHLFPGAIETLEYFKNINIKLVLITNGATSKQWDKINRFDIEKYFEFCLVEGDVGFGKPDKRIYELALSKLGVKSKDTWMVGDNLEWDVEAPQKVGIYGIWNDFNNSGLNVNSKVIPDKIINNISELVNI